MALKLGEIALLDRAGRQKLAKQKERRLAALSELLGDADTKEAMALLGKIDALEEDIVLLMGAQDIDAAQLQERISELASSLALVSRERDMLMIEARDLRATVRALGEVSS